MAENKKGFVLYADIYHTVRHLSNEQAGELFNHILMYVNDQDPVSENPIINIAFEPIKQQLKRDLIKWEQKKTKFSDAGKESAKVRRLKNGDQLYILRMYNDKEDFIKVGVTGDSIGRRYSSDGISESKKSGYKFDIINQFFEKDLNNFSVIDLEKAIEKKFKGAKYTPFNKFGGHTECFSIEILNDLVSYLTSFNDVQQTSTNPTVTDNVNVTVNVTDTVTDNVIKNKREIDFEKFWNLYGKKEGLKKCSAKFQKLKQEEVDKIFEVVEKYVQSTPEKKYRKHPYTWLNGEHWNDEIEITHTGGERDRPLSTIFEDEL